MKYVYNVPLITSLSCQSLFFSFTKLYRTKPSHSSTSEIIFYVIKELWIKNKSKSKGNPKKISLQTSHKKNGIWKEYQRCQKPVAAKTKTTLQDDKRASTPRYSAQLYLVQLATSAKLNDLHTPRPKTAKSIASLKAKEGGYPKKYAVYWNGICCFFADELYPIQLTYSMLSEGFS